MLTSVLNLFRGYVPVSVLLAFILGGGAVAVMGNAEELDGRVTALEAQQKQSGKVLVALYLNQLAVMENLGIEPAVELSPRGLEARR